MLGLTTGILSKYNNIITNQQISFSTACKYGDYILYKSSSNHF